MAEGKKGGRAWLVALLVISVAANAAIVAYFLKKPPPPPDREAENRALLAEIAKGVDPAPFERYFPFGVYLATEGFQRISQLTGRSEIGLYEDAVEDIALHYANLTANQNVNAMPSREFFANVLALYRAYGLKMWVNYQIPYWAEPDEVRRRIEESVGFFKDAPEILAWSFKDEPSTDQLLPMMRATKIVRELDPKMPVMFVFNWDQALWEFAPYVPAAAYDYYVITIGDQNPWQVRRNLENTIAKAGGRNVWFVCQAHSYTGGAVPPSAAELRLMTNHAIAAGAKGALYFLYQIMPYWDNPYIGRTLVSPFGEPTELWEEVGRQGLALRSLAPAILEAKKRDAAEKITFSADVAAPAAFPPDRPAVDGALFDAFGGRLVMVYSNLLDGETTASVTLAEGLRESGDVTLDLGAVARREKAESPDLAGLRLGPAEMRYLWIGPASDGERVKAAILAARAEAEAARLGAMELRARRLGARVAQAETAASPEPEAEPAARLDRILARQAEVAAAPLEPGREKTLANLRETRKVLATLDARLAVTKTLALVTPSRDWVPVLARGAELWREAGAMEDAFRRAEKDLAAPSADLLARARKLEAEITAINRRL